MNLSVDDNCIAAPGGCKIGEAHVDRDTDSHSMCIIGCLQWKILLWEERETWLQYASDV